MNTIRIKQLEQKLGLKKTKIYSLIHEGQLPTPIKFGRASVWVEAEIDEALAKRVHTRRIQSALKRDL